MSSPSNETDPNRRERAGRTRATALITGLLVASLSHTVAAKAETKPSKSYVRKKAWPGGVNATTEFPDDRALPALEAIRAADLAGAIRAAGLGDGPLEFSLRGYSPGSRATLEARAAGRRVAVKAYEEDPASEAALYEALAAAGLGGESNVRVPPLLAWEHDLRVLVIGWLDGPTAHDLVKQGQGRHAGELAAQWARRTASLPVKLGLPFGAAGMMHETRAWIGTLGTADLSVGAAARALAEALARTEPRDDGAVGLVHGTLYARHILDVGECPGVIDWHRFGQGPAELDAGMFLATLSR